PVCLTAPRRVCPSALWRPPASTLFPYTTLFRSRLDLAISLLASDLCYPRSPCPETRSDPRREKELVAIECRQDCCRQFHAGLWPDRKSTRLNSSHVKISYAVFCLKKKKRDDRRS